MSENITMNETGTSSNQYAFSSSTSDRYNVIMPMDEFRKLCEVAEMSSPITIKAEFYDSNGLLDHNNEYNNINDLISESCNRKTLITELKIGS